MAKYTIKCRQAAHASAYHAVAWDYVNLTYGGPTMVAAASGTTRGAAIRMLREHLRFMREAQSRALRAGQEG